MSSMIIVYALYMAAMCMGIVAQPMPGLPPTGLPPMPPGLPPQFPYYDWPQPIIDVGISLVSQSVRISIQDRYASIDYSFYFLNRNTDPASPSSSELDYEISLQPNTFISYFSADLNGVVFRGETKERSQASNEYNKAVETGLNAVLVSQDHDANVFNIQTNIEKGGYVKLNIVAETFMLRRFGYYEFALLTTNIYSSSIIHSEFTHTDITIDLYDESAILSNDIDVITPGNGNFNVEQISNNEYKIDITLQRSVSIRQELILLRYKSETSENMNHVLYDDKSMTFLHVFSYDHDHEHPGAAPAILARRVVFVLDRSGSMGVNKWESAVTATIGAIQHLKAGIDKMNIILFDHVSTLYSTSIVSVTAERIADAIGWLNGFHSRGSTNIYQAVADAIDLIKIDTVLYNSQFEYVNQIILITDGMPTAGITDPILIQNGLYDFNQQQLQTAPASIFCLGIGDDYGDGWVKNLNYPLLRSIATQNEGFDAMIRASQTATILAQYYDILESPVLSYIVLDYYTDGANAERLTRNKYRGLYAGTDIVVAGKLSSAMTGIVVSLSARSSGGNSISMTFPIEFNIAIGDNNVIIDRIWAYLRLKMYRSLLDNPRLAAMNADLFNLLESEALALALEYQLGTPWTSMIVVDENSNTNQRDPTVPAPMPPMPPMYSAPMAPGGVHVTNVQPLPPIAISSDCSAYINDAVSCLHQTLANGDDKCAYNALTGECYLNVQLQQQPVIVRPNSAASVSENNINDGLVHLVVNQDKHKYGLLISIGVTFCVLICLLSTMIVAVYSCYCCKKKSNQQMQILTEINNV